MPSLLLLSMVILAIGITLILLARLFRSCPAIFVGVFVVIVASMLCFVEDVDQPVMGVLWVAFSVLGALFGGLWLIKNKRWAFWFSLGADIGLLVAAFYQYPFSEIAEDGKVNKYIGDMWRYENAKTSALTLEKYGLTHEQALAAHNEVFKEVLIHALIPVLVFLAVAIIGNLVFNLFIPKLKHQKKYERKHLTNTDPLIGQRVTISKDKEDGRSQRGFIGDVDWSIEPLYGYETFKVGDVVKVVTIKGVTLMCTRDGKDYRAEMRAKHKEEMAKQRIEDEKLRAKRKAIKASRELEAEKRRMLQEEERAKRAAELRRIRQEEEEAAAKQKEELEKVRAQRKAAEEARKLELEKAKLAAKAKKREEEAAKKAAEKAAKKEVVKESKQEAVAVEPAKEKKEKPAKKEKVAKEKKESKFLHYDKHRFDLLYFIASIAIIVVCIGFILISVLKLFHDGIRVIQLVFLGLIVCYLFLLFFCEVVKVRERKGENKPVEEKKVEELKVEEVPVEEVKAEVKEKAEFIPFAVRMVNADDFVKEAYNELKSEVLSYGIKSRVSSTSDTFRLHTKAYVKMVVAGKFLKLYLALNPADYKDTTYPFEDASRMGAHEDTPFVFKIKSGLSIRRAKVLIADAAKKDNLEQGEVVKHDHAGDLKEKK